MKALDDFESLPQNFGLVWTHWKFWNFRLGDGENWQNQYYSQIPILQTLDNLSYIGWT